MITTLVQNWWVVALRGVAALFFGLGALLWPGLTLAVLVLLFGAYALTDGLFAIVTGIAARHEQERWWMMVLAGLGGLLTGILTLLWPGITALVLLYLMAGWSMVMGILQIAAAIRLRREIEGEWLLGLAGVGSVIFGLLLATLPGPGALALIWLIGGYALIYGSLLLVLAFRLRGLRRTAAPQPVGAV